MFSSFGCLRDSILAVFGNQGGDQNGVRVTQRSSSDRHLPRIVLVRLIQRRRNHTSAGSGGSMKICFGEAQPIVRLTLSKTDH